LLRGRHCFLHPLTWGWEPTEGIGVLPKIDGVVIVFRARNWPREYGRTLAQRVPIVWTPYLRAVRRTRRIRMRLGAGFSFAEPFPDKPPRMHWRTYMRMRLAAGESIALL
jgi:hypothetical protein